MRRGVLETHCTLLRAVAVRDWGNFEVFIYAIRTNSNMVRLGGRGGGGSMTRYLLIISNN